MRSGSGMGGVYERQGLPPGCETAPAMELRTTDLAAATGGRLDGPDVVVSGASIDTRSLVPGQLFVPIVAERDGHDFVADALAAGAGAYLTARDPHGGTAVVVDDTAAALSAAGGLARDRLSVPVVGITGSVGKTSVKDLLAAALGSVRRVTASERSFNNELGVPLTLLGRPRRRRGASWSRWAPGEWGTSPRCARWPAPPSAWSRGWPLPTPRRSAPSTRSPGRRASSPTSLPADGTAVLFAADERVAAMAARTEARVLTFGEGGDVRAVWVELDDALRPRFTLVSPVGQRRGGARRAAASTRSTTPWPPAAAALACGLSPEEVAAGLAEAVAVAVADGAPHRAERGPGPERRLQRQPGVGGRGAGRRSRSSPRGGAPRCWA